MDAGSWLCHGTTTFTETFTHYFSVSFSVLFYRANIQTGRSVLTKVELLVLLNLMKKMFVSFLTFFKFVCKLLRVWHAGNRRCCTGSWLMCILSQWDIFISGVCSHSLLTLRRAARSNYMYKFRALLSHLFYACATGHHKKLYTYVVSFSFYVRTFVVQPFNLSGGVIFTRKHSFNCSINCSPRASNSASAPAFNTRRQKDQIFVGDLDVKYLYLNRGLFLRKLFAYFSTWCRFCRPVSA